MKKIKIGIDAVPLQKLTGGIGFYVFYLLKEIIKKKQDCLFVLYCFSPTGDIEVFKDFSNVLIRPIPFLSISHSIWSQTTLSFFLWKDKIDIFWGTTQSLPLLQRSKMKNLLTLYDFVYIFCPETMSALKCFYFKLFSKSFFRKADCILPISLNTSRQLKDLYGIDSHAIVYPPIRSQIKCKGISEAKAFLKAYNLEFNNYFVAVGTLEPRKNFIELVQGYLEILRCKIPAEIIPLVIIGGKGWKDRKLQEILHEAKKCYPYHIRLAGFVSDEELALFLSGARYYISLSLYEGYGMPVAEARSCQTPVICFDLPEMREAAENDGIFLCRQNWINELEKIIMEDARQMNEKKELKVNYPATEQTARIIENVLLDLQGTMT